MKKNKFSSFFSVISYCLFVLSLTLMSGCGRKGLLQPAADSTYSYPGHYPPEE